MTVQSGSNNKLLVALSRQKQIFDLCFVTHDVNFRGGLLSFIESINAHHVKLIILSTPTLDLLLLLLRILNYIELEEQFRSSFHQRPR